MPCIVERALAFEDLKVCLPERLRDSPASEQSTTSRAHRKSLPALSFSPHGPHCQLPAIQNALSLGSSTNAPLYCMCCCSFAWFCGFQIWQLVEKCKLSPNLSFIMFCSGWNVRFFPFHIHGIRENCDAHWKMSSLICILQISPSSLLKLHALFLLLFHFLWLGEGRRGGF